MITGGYEILKKQIYIGNSEPDVLKDKVVEKAEFIRDNQVEDDIFVMTFTDGTFIAIGTEYDEDARSDKVVDAYITPSSHSSDCVGFVIYDEDRNPVFEVYKQFKELEKLGILKIYPSVYLESYKKEIDEHQKRDFLYYLKLKNKFENVEKELKDKYNV